MSQRSHIWFAGVLFLCCLLAGCRSITGISPNDDVLFQESFTPGQMGEWQLEGDAAGQVTIINEQLVIELFEPNIMQFATLSTPIFSDFILEVDARQLRGDLQNSYGVLFRMQGPDQFYRFEITGSGLYMLERRNADGTWTRFVDDWSDSPAINRGINEINRLKVEAVERMIAVYVNDELLYQVSDNAYAGGTIALDAGAFARPGIQVAFDNLVVRRP